MTIVIVTKIVTDQKLSQKLSQKVFFDRDSMTTDELLIVIEGLISCSIRSPKVEGNMDEFESQIGFPNLEENF